MPYMALAFVAAGSALRLARFNVDDTQGTNFKGLPTPLNALVLVSLLALWDAPQYKAYTHSGTFLVAVSYVSAVLLNMRLRLWGLKFNHWAWAGNQARYILLVGGLCLLLAFGWAGVPLILVFYVTLSAIVKPAES